MTGGPIDGDALVLAAAKGSVGGKRLPELVETVQEHLGELVGKYRQRYECVYEADDHAVFLVENGHWAEIGDRLDLEDRERESVRRAHAAHLERLGRDLDRGEEFEAALEVREVVVVGTGG